MRYDGLIAGLGNPGERYRGSRHNCGFMFIDALLAYARETGQASELAGKKFHALLWELKLPDIPGVWLAAKPQTFMNDSGASVAPLLAWHGLEPRQLVVAHDELDIPAGALRFKYGGGLAGHNGLASISQRIGSRDFYRLRIGTGKPLAREEVIAWVLSRPAPGDAALIAKAIPEAVKVFSTFCQADLQAAAALAKNWRPFEAN